MSPEEVENLPVNGRNFANLMTLATGATTDGNGGWASVRFNGKSNQQNYLNYDGVDGTYVWDASPGYLNATGSQFRLQTSMESIAEFRVNSGLAPAESGLGSGGNITVISKSGQNQFNGSLFEYNRDDALDARSKYDDKKQELSLDQFGGSIGGPIVRNRTFFFGSFEGLRQTTGLSFTEAVPSDEARRRICAGEPSGAAAGLSAARTQAVAPLLAGFPPEHGADDQRRSWRWPRTAPRQSSRRTRCRCASTTASTTTTRSTSATCSATARSTRRTARPRPAACSPSSGRRTSWPTSRACCGGSMVNEFKVGYNRPETSALGVRPGRLRPHAASRCRARSPRHRSTRVALRASRAAACSSAQRAPRRRSARSSTRSLSFSNALTIDTGAHTIKGGGEYRRIQSQFQFLGSTEISTTA